MASEDIDQTILIKDLNTKTVTLYPSQAHITRDINDVILKPGINTIELFGLSPTVDEHSVQVDGKGSATIVDMSVEMVPNRDVFEEIYPDKFVDFESDHDDDYNNSDDEPQSVKVIDRELRALKVKLAQATEKQNSANQRLAALDRYMNSIEAKSNPPNQMSTLLATYQTERASVFQEHENSSTIIQEINKNISRKEAEKAKAGKALRREKEKRQVERKKELRLKRLKREETLKEARHIKDERLRFWPKKVYRVILQLETGSLDTPNSSRRGSIDSVTLSGTRTQAIDPEWKSSKGASAETLVSLSLSYVTRAAAWGPRYDIKVNSTQKSATIVYRTEFINHTSETWKDAKVSFSNSQTSFQGVDDAVPHMHPWHVKLLDKNGMDHDEGLLSWAEKHQPRRGQKSTAPFNRANVFGKDTVYVEPKYDHSQQRQHWGKTANTNNNGGVLDTYNYELSSNAIPPPRPLQASQHAQQQASSSFGALAPQQAGGLFGAPAPNAAPPPPAASRSAAQQDYQMQLMLLEQQNKNRLRMARQEQEALPAPGTAFGSSSAQPDWSNLASGLEEFNFASLDPEESSWEDNGLTATYDIPGVRTLIPSSQTRRHKLASLSASNITISHIAVPKLRAAAFLRAKIRNPSSSVTLLKGSAGITLDGSFLGNWELPRVAPSQVFTLPLGVDPGIHVAYPKPTVRRSTAGIFTKEHQQVYSRSAWLTNTKSIPVDILVLDQIPVSEEDKLKIEVLLPAGLSREGAVVRAGVSAKDAAAAADGGAAGQGKAGKWGSATAGLKKEGKVEWNVKLEKGAACLLRLDYEARMPSGERIAEGVRD